jgi:glycosyltransferase involved in cell wall biosynthesis
VASSTVEPIGVDVADIPEEPGAIRKDRVLIVGHITPRKGHDLLARAVGRLAASRPNIEVISVGSYGMGFWGGRPFREHLEREVERSGARWTFVEHLDRSELIRLYRTCAAVAVPSRFESFSMAALEGLLASRPVLLSDRCGLVERVESGSDSGVWVTPAGDCEALASALDHVLDQVSTDPQGVGGRARASGIAIGDVDRLVPDRIALYKRVAASR